MTREYRRQPSPPKDNGVPGSPLSLPELIRRVPPDAVSTHAHHECQGSAQHWLAAACLTLPDGALRAEARLVVDGHIDLRPARLNRWQWICLIVRLVWLLRRRG